MKSVATETTDSVCGGLPSLSASAIGKCIHKTPTNISESTTKTTTTTTSTSTTAITTSTNNNNNINNNNLNNNNNNNNTASTTTVTGKNTPANIDSGLNASSTYPTPNPPVSTNSSSENTINPIIPDIKFTSVFSLGPLEFSKLVLRAIINPSNNSPTPHEDSSDPHKSQLDVSFFFFFSFSFFFFFFDLNVFFSCCS